MIPSLLKNVANPTFVLPLSDSGAGAVNTAVNASGGSGTPTFTRATTAWTKLSTGLWASVASGTARSFYLGMSTAVGAYGGYLQEEARTNEVLWSRDLTNAAWTKVTTTAALDQVGIDGVASSATSLLATGANSTTLQVITEAASSRVFSAFVKRITGVGEIDMTEDGGTTWTNVTASINSSTYTQVNAAAQSVLNPSVGFRIVTSGDKIAVDMCQNEVPTGNAAASTPIPTTTVAVTRNADVLTYPFAGNVDTTQGTAYAEYSILATATSTRGVVCFTTGATNLLGQPTTAGSFLINDGTNTLTKTSLATVVGAVRKRAASWGGAGQSVTGDGLAVTTGSFDGAMANTAIGIGSTTNGGIPLNGTVMNVKIWTQQLPDAKLSALTA